MTQRVSSEWCREVVRLGTVPGINLVGAPDVAADLLDSRARIAQLEAALRWALKTLEPPAWAKVNIDPDHRLFDAEMEAARAALTPSEEKPA